MPHSPSPLIPLLADPVAFAAAGGCTLRPYQAEVVRAIARSVLRRRGQVLSVMFARQMGKNETSAQLEAYLLAVFAARGGTLVKAAPSFKPQVITSLLRLRETLDRNPLTRRDQRGQFGYMVGVGNASLAFFSAERHANVVGATASLLLEIDEAQDVEPDKYDRDFRPMASSTNATTVLWGTAWGEDSILERQRRINLEHERRTGERLHFEYDWTALAHLSPAYDAYVRGEIARLGIHHPTVRTQYLLHCLADAGRLLSTEQLAALQGSYGPEHQPDPNGRYVAGIDLAGEDEEADDAGFHGKGRRNRDSTVITIGRVESTGSEPVVRVVRQVHWTGKEFVWQYDRLLDLCRHWRVTRACVDASGIGAGIAAFLHSRLGDRVERFVFTAPSKSTLGFALLAMINSGRLSIHTEDGSEEWRQCWSELRDCRYQLRAREQLDWSAPAGQHDDFVVSLALCARAAGMGTPPAASGLWRPPPPVDERNGW